MTQTMTELQLTSPAFAPGGVIPREYTADGRGVSPPLRWGSVPAGTKSLVLICEDPDAPAGLFTHWLAYNLPAGLTGLDAGVPADPALPDGTRQGKNDFGKTGYGAPAPPRGNPHRYVFRLSALDARLDLEPGAVRDEVTTAMFNHVLAEGDLTGTYGR
jgi:Raf kinase inhibitor-like YbhB/YbcL family protein